MMTAKTTARNKASIALKTILLQEIGSFVQANVIQTTNEDNFTSQINFSEVVSSVTGGKVQMKILAENWNGTQFWMKAEMAVDVNEILSYLDQQRKATEQAEEKKRAQQQEISNIQKQITAAQQQVEIEEQHEAQARKNKVIAEQSAENARLYMKSAEKQYSSAVTLSGASPQDKTIKAQVRVALSNLDSAQVWYDERSTQAGIAKSQWEQNILQLNQVREYLESMQRQLQKLGYTNMLDETKKTATVYSSGPLPQKAINQTQVYPDEKLAVTVADKDSIKTIGIYFIPKFGLNITRMHGYRDMSDWDFITSPRVKVMFGVGLQLMFNRFFAFEPEILFDMRRSAVKVMSGGFDCGTSSLKVNCIEVPLKFNVMFSNKTLLTPVLNTAPVIGFPVVGYEGEENIKEHMNNVEFAIALGIGAHFKTKNNNLILFETRILTGLTDVVRGEEIFGKTWSIAFILGVGINMKK
ncbi:MAG TPA: outer membrane beta-barrel protein [Chitinispirillaceae bacterium]|nr:outer membrane beta-barrel protein [Chitinispirillaceae bacterium]